MKIASARQHRSIGVSVLAFALAISVTWFASATSAASPVTARPAGRAPWVPAAGTTWQWQLIGHTDTSYDVDMYDIDLQDAVPTKRVMTVPGFGDVTWPKGINSGVIEELHARGIIVICYVDTGSWERYRPDASLFPRKVLGTVPYASNGDPWKGERWLDIREEKWPKWTPLMWSRFDLAADIGCDGVEPDENNPFGNDSGFPATKQIQETWYLEVAAQAHARGLSVGQKNGIETTTPATIAAFDWNLNEECFQYRECSLLSPVVDAGKVVFNTEYRGEISTICAKAADLGFSTIKKRLKLDSWIQFC